MFQDHWNRWDRPLSPICNYRKNSSGEILQIFCRSEKVRPRQRSRWNLDFNQSSGRISPFSNCSKRTDVDERGWSKSVEVNARAPGGGNNGKKYSPVLFGFVFLLSYARYQRVGDTLKKRLSAGWKTNWKSSVNHWQRIEREKEKEREECWHEDALQMLYHSKNQSCGLALL